MSKTFKHVVQLKKPGRKEIDAFIADQADQTFSYDEVGGTSRIAGDKAALDERYRVAHHRFLLGKGEETYERARRALKQWKSFDIDWVQFCWPDFTPRPGLDMAILGKDLGVWLINACRVLHAYDDGGEVACCGFVMGTLPDHMLAGEERMQVEWHRKDDKVWYEILSFSRKKRWLAKLGAFHVHHMQKRFAQESCKAMKKAIAKEKKQD